MERCRHVRANVGLLGGLCCLELPQVRSSQDQIGFDHYIRWRGIMHGGSGKARPT